ncbi:MAG TPA: protease pro-enzyme activation domain-containing protein, partial [Thermoplasmata archaeon]|nr:protease pro-enzyme activation domain-containing protein [Thermoplasmata archaeon]
MPRHRFARSWSGIVLLATSLIVLLAPTVGLGGASPLAPTVVGGIDGSPQGGMVVVAPGFLPPAGAVDVGPLPAATSLDVLVGLAPYDPTGLSAAIALEYAPGTPTFHHFLDPSALADRYGSSIASVDRSTAYFEGFGLEARPSADRLLLEVHGSSAAVGHAFDTSFETYRSGDRTFYSHLAPARLPEGLATTGVLGLGNLTTPTPFLGRTATTTAHGPAPAAPPGCPITSYLTPCEAQRVYNLTRIVAAGHNGTGFKVGIVDAYDGYEPQGQLTSDFASFARQYKLPTTNLTIAYPVPVNHDLNSTYTGWGLEEALDVEWVRAMSPGAAILMALSPNPTTGLYESVDWLVAHDAVNAISLSWGEPDVGLYNAFQGPCKSACNATSDGSYTLLHPVLAEAAAEGIGVYAATGDCGAAAGTSGVSTDYPASDPYVTAVGGTDLTLNASGGYGSEAGWSGNASGAFSPGCVNSGGSGGGFSPFPRPAWQSAAGLSSRPAVRAAPDVSMPAGTPGAEVVFGGQTSPAGGTSLASPMWAGLAADADSASGGALGFLNPSLYTIGRNASGALAFHDVRTGWNGYNAGAGWDAVTGLGTPNAQVLVPLLTSTPLSAPGISVNLSASPRFGGVPLSVTLNARASGGSGNFSFFALDFGDGNSSLSSNGSASHTYEVPGVFDARAVAFDNRSNTSSAEPIAVVVGGGGSLNVTLNASTSSPTVGLAVTYSANVAGGSGPYRYDYAFGDGTFLDDTNASTASHAYQVAGAYCANVIVRDGRSPPDGGASPGVAVGVGGATPPTCAKAPRITANLTVTPTASDLPGDLAFRASASGGTGPYSVAYGSSDPYVVACQCGVFSRTGNQTIR